MPTNTPLPTSTPIPTASSTTEPPPEPIMLTGYGDSIVDVQKWDGAAVLHAKYNGERNFAIENYGPGNDYLDLLVNTIGAYDGVVPVDFFESEYTVRLKVTASDSWEIEILPLQSLPEYDLPALIFDKGDKVVYLKGGNADVITADASPW